MPGVNVLLLKKEVENAFGKKILSSSDCNLLMVDIYQLTEQSISLNTLRRVFNLMKSKFSPSQFTLNILSAYCGYSSYSDFIDQMEDNSPADHHEDSIFLNVLLAIFKKIEFTGDNKESFQQLMTKLITNLIYAPKLIDRFQRGVAKTENGQKFYFETFINYDHLSRFYGKGLRYYMQEKKTEEAHLFANSLLCFNSWLMLENNGVSSYYSKVAEIDIEKIYVPYLKGRYYAALLMEANVNGKEAEDILSEAKNVYLNAGDVKCRSSQCFEFVMSETLVLIKKYDEAYFYINEALKKSNNFPSDGMDKYAEMLESFLLLKAIALAGLGRKNLSKQILDKIHPQNFSFLSRNFNSILYLSLQQIFQRKEVVQNQIHYLVEQTGFKRLLHLSQELQQHEPAEVGKNGHMVKSIAI